MFARRGYAFLVNKYYLDDLYESVIVAGIKGPIARVSYWINQNVIDAIVKGAGLAARSIAGGTYIVDHDVLDAGLQHARPGDRAHRVVCSGGSRPVVSSGTPSFMFAAIGAVRPRPRDLQLSKGERFA